ncbi:MAG: (Fe-S)-binding protein [Methanosarcinales archaeon]
MPNVIEIYQLLPKTNCKKCKESTCMAYAVALLQRKKQISDCPPLIEEEKYKSNLEKLTEILSPVEGATETGMIIHEDLCFGCGNCVVACPVNVANDPHGCAIGLAPSNDKVILFVKGGKITSKDIQQCRRFGEDKILCNACIVTCPSKAIEFV